MNLDVDAAFTAYLRRFSRHYGAKLPGTFVRFGHHMVQKLDRDDFEQRMEAYLGWHRECARVLESGATISDAAVLEFEESAAWLALEVPNLLELFEGELGDPNEALGRTEARHSGSDRDGSDLDGSDRDGSDRDATDRRGPGQ